jgi:diguanylate cyclase (GGDEF)-like protein/PAS domain S-box-containing protein
MADSDGLGPDDIAEALADALARHPDAGVAAITRDGQFCDVPASVPLDRHPLLSGRSVFDVVSASSHQAVIEGWRQTRDHGVGVAAVQTPDGQGATIHCFDTQATHGVFVMLLMPGEVAAPAVVDEEAPLTSRFGTYRRDILATVIGLDEQARRLLGWELSDLAAAAAIDLIHPDDQARANDNWLETLAKPDQPQRYRARHLRSDGTWLWLEITNTNRLHDPEHEDVLSEMSDISEEMATAEALRERQELLRRLTEALPLGVLQIDRDGRVLYANNRLHEIVGRDAAETMDDQLQAVLVDDRPRLATAVERVLRRGQGAEVEVRLRHAGASEDVVCDVAIQPISDAAGNISGAVACLTDLTERTRMRRELERRATYDQLTGCHNRASTMAKLDEVMGARAAGSGQSAPGSRTPGVGVIFVDLDRFKPINDELGHAAGDALLIVIADRLRTVVRADDIVGRLGGDEFLVVCPSLSSPAALDEIARRIPPAISQPIPLAGRLLDVRASVGVAWSLDGYTTSTAIVAAADAAMYVAKRSAADPTSLLEPWGVVWATGHH